MFPAYVGDSREHENHSRAGRNLVILIGIKLNYMATVLIFSLEFLWSHKNCSSMQMEAVWWQIYVLIGNAGNCILMV